MDQVQAETALWALDWEWSLPLVLATVLFHVWALRLIQACVVTRAAGLLQRHETAAVMLLALTVMLITALHGAEAAAWGYFYVRLGALPDARSAILYSLSAMTSYGHEKVYLAPAWQLMGAIQSLNGVILLGLTTAYLLGVLRVLWPPAVR